MQNARAHPRLSLLPCQRAALEDLPQAQARDGKVNLLVLASASGALRPRLARVCSAVGAATFDDHRDVHDVLCVTVSVVVAAQAGELRLAVCTQPPYQPLASVGAAHVGASAPCEHWLVPVVCGPGWRLSRFTVVEAPRVRQATAVRKHEVPVAPGASSPSGEDGAIAGGAPAGLAARGDGHADLLALRFCEGHLSG